MLTAGFASLTQILVDLAIAIYTAAFKPRMLDQSQEALIIPVSIRQCFFAPCVVAARVHGHHAAQATYRILARMLLNKRVPQSDSLAKYAVALS